MLWIISGPSSAGKTHFMHSQRCSELTGISSETPIYSLHTGELEQKLAASGDYLLHYNLLRPWVKTYRRERRKSSGMNMPFPRPVRRLIKRVRRKLNLHGDPVEHKAKTNALNQPVTFENDQEWKHLLRSDIPKKVIVLVARKRVLVQRVAARPLRAEPGDAGPYPADWHRDVYAHIDLTQLYEAWCRELERNQIPYILIDANDDRYTVLDSLDTILTPEYALESPFPRPQIEEILERERFVYHRVNLPYGLYTSGDDRSANSALIFPAALVGKSVLDVGCGIGYYCFEAESRGAKRVVGTELKPDRFAQANRLKELTQSQVTFLQQDVLSEPLDESFDYVLLLNVVHHLPDPVGMIRHLASYTRERLIIEFPTFVEPAMRKSMGLFLPELLNRLPVIGVGGRPAPRQMFAFSPEALRRILKVHDNLFARVELIRSPLPGRMIAICHKAGDVSED